MNNNSAHGPRSLLTGSVYGSLGSLGSLWSRGRNLALAYSVAITCTLLVHGSYGSQPTVKQSDQQKDQQTASKPPPAKTLAPKPKQDKSPLPPQKYQSNPKSIEDSSQDIKLVTWNIEWYPGGNSFASGEDRQLQRMFVAEEIKKIQPTILASQEIKDWESFYDVCKEVPGLRPVTVSYFPREELGNYWPQQIAIGSKLRVQAAWCEPWKKSPEGANIKLSSGEESVLPRRGFAVAALYLPNSDDVLLVYSVHLKSNRVEEGSTSDDNYTMREESARQLVEHTKYLENFLFKNKVAGIVVTGDFNTNEDGEFQDDTLKILRDAGFYHTWQGVPQDQRITWGGNSKHQKACLDHVFTKYLEKPETQILNTSPKASDHFALKTTLTRENYRTSNYILDFLEKIDRLSELTNPSPKKTL